MIEANESYAEDYQMRMLKTNRIEGILEVRSMMANGRARFSYDIDGMVSMKAAFEKSSIGGKELRALLENLATAREEIENHLLLPERILLSPEYIFCGEERYHFCYYPIGRQDSWSSFEALVEFFVNKIDSNDADAIQMAFALEKGCKEGNYSISKLISNVLQMNKKESFEKWKEEGMREIYDYVADLDDEIEPLEIREEKRGWFSLPKFRKKQKKKALDFEELYSE
jgi:hypothetical protein